MQNAVFGPNCKNDVAKKLSGTVRLTVPDNFYNKYFFGIPILQQALLEKVLRWSSEKSRNLSDFSLVLHEIIASWNEKIPLTPVSLPRNPSSSKNAGNRRILSSCLLLKKKTLEKCLICLLLKNHYPQKCGMCPLLKKEFDNYYFSCLLFLTGTPANCLPCIFGQLSASFDGKSGQIDRTLCCKNGRHVLCYP